MIFDLPPPPKFWTPPRPAIIRPAPLIKEANFLPGWFPGAVVAPAADPFSLTYITNVQDEASATTYNFASVSFGEEAVSRFLVISTMAYRSGTMVVSSATIGGVSASILQCTGTNVGTALLYAEVPTGTTGTVSITFSASQLACSIGVFRFTGLTSTTPFDTDNPAGGGAASRTNTIDTPAGGGLISTSGGDNVGTWTNNTEQFDVDFDGSQVTHSSAMKTSASLISGETITRNACRAICSASWV